MKFLTDKSGQLYRVADEDAELVNGDEIDKLLSEAQDEVAMLQAAAASIAAAGQNNTSNSSTDSADGSSQSLVSSI